MNIFRGPRTGKSWQRTDSKDPSDYANKWSPGTIIMFDGTIDKNGERHTDLGIELEESDIVALSNALVRYYQQKAESPQTELRAVEEELEGNESVSQEMESEKHAPQKAKAKAKRRSNPDFMKSLQISAALAEIVGKKALPRTQVVKKLWEYIRKNGLQDSEDRRMINADNRLKAVFDGKERVSMFDLTKMVNKHLS